MARLPPSETRRGWEARPAPQPKGLPADGLDDPCDGGAALAPSTQELRGRALRWLAQREHSPAELRAKLLRLGAPPELAEELLARLQEDGHLSEARYMASRIRLRAPRFGTQRIAAELRQRGAAPDAATLEALRATELSRATAVWTRRYRQASSDPRERARQARFLLQRGFSGEVVRRVVAGAADAALADVEPEAGHPSEPDTSLL